MILSKRIFQVPMIVKSMFLFLWFISLATSEKGKSYKTMPGQARSSSSSSQEKEKYSNITMM